MKLVIVSGRFPEYGQKGDQLRTRQLLELLAAEHEIHLVTGGRPSDPATMAEVQALARVTLIPAGPLARSLAALGALARGRPAEVGWMSPRRLRRAVRAAAPGSDAAIAATARVVTGPLAIPLILDHVDALSVNMRERGRLERKPLFGLAARGEAMLLARHERLAARWASAQLAVSERDVLALPQSPLPVVIPHVVFNALTPDQLRTAQDPAGRDIDVILTGNMKYPPNRDAAGWLAHEIVPELRRLRPHTRVVVAGRGAKQLSLEGIEVASDVHDLSALLRRSRVAIVPLRGGTGVPNKLLEAAAAGAAIVATPSAAAAAEIATMTASDANALAAAAATLLGDEELRAGLAVRALEDLLPRAPAVVAERLREVLRQAVPGGTRAS